MRRRSHKIIKYKMEWCGRENFFRSFYVNSLENHINFAEIELKLRRKSHKIMKYKMVWCGRENFFKSFYV